MSLLIILAMSLVLLILSFYIAIRELYIVHYNPLPYMTEDLSSEKPLEHIKLTKTREIK